MPVVSTPTGPPSAAHEPHEHVAHGVRRPDPFHWMRRLDAPVLAHLSAEREWYDVATGHLGPLVQKLRAEMTGRVPATDSSVSWPQHGYSYRTVLPAGREYVQLLRRRDGAGDDEPDELLLDVNELAGDADYVDLGLWGVSPDASLMAYSVDFDGDEVYELRFRDLASGRDLADVVPRTAPGGAWSADSSHFFYLVHDELWRQHQVWRHRLGTPASADELVLEEPDGQFELEVRGDPDRRPGGDLVGEPGHQRGLGLDAARPTSPALLGRRSPARGGVPRRAREARRRLRRAAAGDQRRGDRVPAGAVPGAALGRPGLVRVGAGATRGPVRAARAGGRVRRTRRAHVAHRRPQPAAHPAARRPQPARASSSGRSRRSRRCRRRTSGTSSTTWTGSSSWTSPT